MNILDDIVFLGEDGKMGVKDCKGNLLVPAKYDWIEDTYNRRQRNELKISHYIVMKDCKAGLVSIDGTGTEVLPCEYDDIQRLGGTPFYIVSRSGDTGSLVCPIDGKVLELVPECFDTLEVCQGRVIKYYDKSGKVGICEYNKLFRHTDQFYDSAQIEDVCIVRKGKRKGYLDSRLMFTPRREEAFVFDVSQCCEPSECL